MGDITAILKDWDVDRDAAAARLTPMVYGELHKIASGYMRRESGGHTLQPTALVNEAYMKLMHGESLRAQDRTHFYALAAKIMRGILVDFARARATQKRGSGQVVPLEPNMDLSPQGAADFLVLHDALERLRSVDARKANVVELRYFGGLSFDEIAQSESISLITAKRDAAFAEAWLRRALSEPA